MFSKGMHTYFNIYTIYMSQYKYFVNIPDCIESKLVFYVTFKD